MRHLTLAFTLFLVASDVPAQRLAPPPIRTVRTGETGGGCKAGMPVSVSLKCRGTPIVGQAVDIDLAVHNGYGDGRFRIWLALPAGSLEPLGPAIWEDDLAVGESRTYSVRVKVLTSERVAITGKALQLDAGRDGLPASEGYLALFPFESRNGTITARWANRLPSAFTITSDGHRVKRIRLPIGE